VWPAVSYSSRRLQEDDGEDRSLDLDDFPAPPKFALNGVSDAIPVSPYKKSFSIPVDTESEESKARREVFDGHGLTYPEIIPSSFQKPASSDSPIIPLSPDPFGRYPSFPDNLSSLASDSLTSQVLLPQAKVTYSTFEIPTERHASLNLPGKNNSFVSEMGTASLAPSSRFSLDSSDEGRNNRTGASINPVKSIKSLWRKSRKASISFGSGSALASLTGFPHPLPPVPSISGPSTSRSPGPSHRYQESVTNVALPPERHPLGPLPHDTPSQKMPPAVRPPRGSSSTNTLVFNQDSPYPVRVSVPRPSAPRPRAASQGLHPLLSSSTHRLLPVSERPASLGEADAMPPQTPLTADSEKTGVPKSILKARRMDHPSPSPSPSPSPGTRQSRTDSVRPMGGGQAIAPPPSFEPAHLSPTTARTRPNRRPTHQPSPDVTFENVDPVPSLEPEQHT
jgi:hypothetical protein